MKTNERNTATETSLELKAEKAISAAVNHEVKLNIVYPETPYMAGYILNYECLKTGKHFLVRVWNDQSAPVVYICSE